MKYVLAFLAIVGVASCSQPSLDAQLAGAASEINKTCPFMIDADTRMENVVALPGKVFQYNYTIVKLNKSEIDTALFKSTIIPYVVNALRTNPELKLYRDNDVNMAYSYSDKNGVFVYKFIVAPKDYK